MKIPFYNIILIISTISIFLGIFLPCTNAVVLGCTGHIILQLIMIQIRISLNSEK